MKPSLQSKQGRPAERSREFYTIADVADMLQVEQITVRRMIRRGLLAAHRIGRAYRIRRVDIEDFLSRCRIVGQQAEQ